jgi:hypothetical protein
MKPGVLMGREQQQWTMHMNLLSNRRFSSSGGPEKKESANDYESGFENLM